MEGRATEVYDEYAEARTWAGAQGASYSTRPPTSPAGAPEFPMSPSRWQVPLDGMVPDAVRS